jgi:hypothetical protein
MGITDWIALIPTISMLASAFCAMTDTPKDDELLSRWSQFYAKHIYPAINTIALNINKAKS